MPNGFALRDHPACVAAIAARQHRFDTGEACERGHFPAPRYVSNGACVECTKASTRANARRKQDEQRAFVADCLKRKNAA